MVTNNKTNLERSCDLSLIRTLHHGNYGKSYPTNSTLTNYMFADENFDLCRPCDTVKHQLNNNSQESCYKT